MYEDIRVGDKIIVSKYLFEHGRHRGKKGTVTVADYDSGRFVITFEDGSQGAIKGFGLIKYRKHTEWWKV